MAIFFCQAAAAPSSTPPKNTLVIGKVSNDPQKHYQYLKPMADYAAGQMQDLGIEGAGVLMAKDNAQMVEFLRQGKVDWVTETAFSALVYQHNKVADLLLRKWKKDAAQYHTIFFARKESPVNSLEDLLGRVLVLEDPGSTTAFFEPIMCLFKYGLQIQKLDSYKQRPSPDKVGYVFSRQEINSSVWVHKEFVDAGAFNNQDWNKSDHMYKNIRKDLKIFYRSEPLPRAFELVRTGLNPHVRERLKSILLKAHQDPKAQKALRAYQSTRQFDEIDEATAGILKIMQERFLETQEAID